MAAARFDDPIEPMDLANMRQNGVRSLAAQCHQCRHEVIMNVDRDSGIPPWTGLRGNWVGDIRSSHLSSTSGQAHCARWR